MTTPTAEQLDEMHMAIRGYIWWTNPDGYKLSRSRGISMAGRASKYTLTCPLPNTRTGASTTYRHKRFRFDHEAIEWAIVQSTEEMKP